MVSIPACHAGDRGSIPRRAVSFAFSCINLDATAVTHEATKVINGFIFPFFFFFAIESRRVRLILRNEENDLGKCTKVATTPK